MRVSKERLLGLWSNDEVFVGAMEHDLIWFQADGLGVYAWENAYVSTGSVFMWEIEGDRLTTHTLREFHVDETDPQPEGSDGWPLDLVAARVTIAVEAGPYGRRPLVLRISASGDDRSHAYGYVGATCPPQFLEEIARTRQQTD